MSFVKTGYRVFSKLEEIFKRKSFKTVFIAISSMILFFGVMNVYAQEDFSGIEPDWKGIKAACNLGSGTEADEANMTSHLCQESANTIWSFILNTAPGITVGKDEIKDSNLVPSDMKNGLIGVTDSYINYAFVNQPEIDVMAHLGNEWVPGYDKSEGNLYAAGYENGYQELMNSGVANLWSRMRDLAYVFFVIVMIVIGFMIMFRSKLGGQTLVSLGNTIPNVILGLILVTFSFAIAGIIIDIGGIFTSVISSVFDDEGISIQRVGGLVKVLFSGISFSDLGTQVFDTAKDMLPSAGDFANGLAEGLGISALKVGLVATGITMAGFTGPAAVGVPVLLITLVAIGIVFVGAIRLIITLYKSYFGILIGTILGPLQIMIGTLPGQQHMTMNWLKTLARNVLVFPVVFFIVNIPVMLADEEGIMLDFPEKLTNAPIGDGGINNIDTVGLIGMFILRVFVLYFAAQTPKFLEGLLPPNTSKPMMEGIGNAKASLSKIPLVGSLFK